MFGNFSMPELLIVGALALIVIGPKDLPRMMRSVGKFVGQARGLARQFQRSMDDAARELDVQEFKDANKLLNSPAGVDDFAKPFKEKVGLDDDDEKPKKPAMSAGEMAEAAKEFSDEPKPEPGKPKLVKSDLAENTAEPETPESPEPAQAKQG